MVVNQFFRSLFLSSFICIASCLTATSALAQSWVGHYSSSDGTATLSVSEVEGANGDTLLEVFCVENNSVFGYIIFDFKLLRWVIYSEEEIGEHDEPLVYLTPHSDGGFFMEYNDPNGESSGDEYIKL